MKKNSEYIGVDEKFVPENEKFVDESLLGNRDETKRTIKKVAKGFGIGYLVFIGIFLVIFIGMFIFAGSFIFNVGKTVDEQIDNLGSQTDAVGGFIGKIQGQFNQQEVDSFNWNFEMYSGTSSRLSVTTLLDKVVTNNKKNSDTIITVIYNETTTTDPNEIVELKPSFEQGKKYEVILDYNTNGLVNKVTIKDIP